MKALRVYYSPELDCIIVYTSHKRTIVFVTFDHESKHSAKIRYFYIGEFS